MDALPKPEDACLNCSVNPEEVTCCTLPSAKAMLPP